MADRSAGGTAYSYIRFSSREQERGDSVRRQTELRNRWLADHPGVTLDTALTLRDLGVSAFRGGHRSDKHALGLFVDQVKAGRVPKGSYLLIESLDRLTREETHDAMEFLLKLTKDVVVVQLSPQVVEYRYPCDSMSLMLAVVELSRGNAESRIKSERVGAAWARKRAEAAATGKPITGRVPAWLERVGDGFRLKPAAARAVKTIYDLCRGGMGYRAVVRELERLGVPAIGPSGVWDAAYVRLILASRATVGEFQQYTGAGPGRKPAGPPIPGYFPAVVTEAEFQEAHLRMGERKNRGGRPRKDRFVNVFGGMLRLAGGDRLQVTGRTRAETGEQYRVLVPSTYRRRGGSCLSFPLETFEAAVLSLLKEVDPRELFPDAGAEAARADALARRLAEVDRLLEEIGDELGLGSVRLLAAKARAMEAERAKLVEDLAAARREAAHPLAADWSMAMQLADALGAAADQVDARTRLKAAIGRVAESIWCLIVPRKSGRAMWVQVRFRDGKSRHYVIRQLPGWASRHGSRPPQWRAASHTGPSPDLADPAAAGQIEAALLAMPMDDF